MATFLLLFTALCFQTDVEGLQADVEGLQADVEGLQADVEGLQADVEAPKDTSDQATNSAERSDSWALHEAMRRSSPHADLDWELIGPVFSGGRIESIAAHPSKPSTMYVGVGSGGLWKTVNAGTTWKPIFDHQSSIAVGDVAVSASAPDTIWLGTGEVLLARSSLPGSGVFKSVDAGATWMCMGLVDTQHIARVIIHPTNPSIVYVAAIGHQNSNNQQRGVFRTIDGGETWEKVLYINDHTAAIDLAMHPSHPETLFASMWARTNYSSVKSPTPPKPSSGIYRTTDAGDNWESLTNGLPTGKNVGRIAIAIAPSAPSTLYALADEGQRDGLYCSTDGGDSWQKRSEELQARWDWCELRVSPDDSQQVYSIGQNSYISSDGGNRFKKIEGEIVHLLPHGADVIHLDTHSMWINPSNADHVVFGTDGGIFVSHDRCQTWLHYNNMPISECYAVTLDMEHPPNAYIGTQDNAALFGPITSRPKTGRPDPWQHVYLDPWGGGDSYFTYQDPSDAGTIFYEHQMGELRRKDMLSGEVKRIQPSVKGERLRFAWMSPFFPSSHDKRTWYFGANRVFKSTDRGDSWKPISEDLVSDDKVKNPRYRAVTTLAESPLQAGLIIAGTDNADLHVTKDDGLTWTSIDADFPKRTFSRVLASVHSHETIFTAQSGAGIDDFKPYVFRSDDLGESWVNIGQQLPSEPVNVVLEDPKVAGLIYVGTDMGVYASYTGDGKWVSLCGNLPTASVYDMAIHPRDNVLVIATHGRSCFAVDPTPIQSAAMNQATK